MYSIINFSIILIRQKTKNKRHIAFTGKKKLRGLKRVLCTGRGAEKKTGGCKRKTSSALKGALSTILDPEKEKMHVLYLFLPKQMGPEFRGTT